MRIQTVLTLSAALLMAAGRVQAARADTGPWTSRVSVDGGVAIPTPVNGFSDEARTGLVGGIQYLHNLDYFTAVGIQVEGYQFDGKDHAVTSSAGGRLNANSQVDAAAIEIVGRYTFLPMARFIPYVHTGLGANVLRQTTDGTPLPGFTWSDTNTSETRRLPDVNSVGISFSFGAGVETNLTDRIVLGLEATWRILGVSKAAYGNAEIDVPSLAMRLGWRFGQEPLPPGP